MPRKAVDSRIPTLIRNGVQSKKRSFFVVVGDHSKDVIVHLYYILSSIDVGSNKSVLWAYKNKLLDFTSHRKKRENKIKKEIRRGTREANTNDPFELFVSLHNIRYVYYKETDKILGNTYGMCILQDFEAITPNILARTMETVEGGGLVILLLKGITSLKQLYTMSMDVHARYRTEAHDGVVPRFNERFILSLGGCESCLIIDDELNVLPISGGKNVKALPPPEDPDEEGGVGGGAIKSDNEKQLDELKDALRDTPPVGSLISLARTLDQGRALLTFVDAITEKSLQGTVSLTAARGRGKSAAMGLAVAAGVAHGYSNIFITSPSPENLKTFFDFVFRGFDALGYLDHIDYTIIRSTNAEFANKPVVRVNIHRNNRQTIQYIRPQDAHVLGQAELLVIDEAAAIPLPLVRRLIGPYLIFMASTINGYEGTGRSLSLKLVKQLREQSRSTGSGKKGSSSGGDKIMVADRSTGRAAKDQDDDYNNQATGHRTLREIALSEPIRYAQGDGVEKWLNSLLCLDVTAPRAKAYPVPAVCELLHVNRDTLFSFHPVPEHFLQKMVALFVSSHYKNTPDDLQLMSDAPAHELYVLVPPVSEESRQMPEPLCVIQVALEGRISRASVLNSLHRGTRPSGDLIPWLVSQQFQDEEFAALSGARIVRIATNPDCMDKGYGSRAIELLTDYFSGKFASLREVDVATGKVFGGGEGGGAKGMQEPMMKRLTDEDLSKSMLLADDIKVRDISEMPPLFARLSERSPPALDYLGVSYGLTGPLLRFWKRATFAPVYLRQTTNELTGEHTCVMLRPLELDGSTADSWSWLAAFARDFNRRYLWLLANRFRDFPSTLAVGINEAALAGVARYGQHETLDPRDRRLDSRTLDDILSGHDLKRLDAYANGLVDYHLVLDLLPQIALPFFTGRLVDGGSSSSDGKAIVQGVQKCILLAAGLQGKELEAVAAEYSLSVSQVLAMLSKIMRKMAKALATLVTEAADAQLSRPKQAPLGVSQADASGMHDDEVVDKRFEPLGVSFAEELAAEMAAQREGEEDESGEGGVVEGSGSGGSGKKGRKQLQRELIDALPLDQYEIEQDDRSGWAEAEKQVVASLVSGSKGGLGKSTTVSIKSSKKRQKAGETMAEIYEEVHGEKKSKKRKH